MGGKIGFNKFHLLLFAASITVAVYFGLSQDIHYYIENTRSFGYVGALFAGFFFSSILTTAPATMALFLLGHTLNPLLIALVAAIGAMSNDFILFMLIKHKMSHHYGLFEKIRMWLVGRKVFNRVKGHRILKYMVPLAGALIIASPLPDELGIAVLGASKYNNKKFFLLAFAMNFLGIFVISSLNAVF